MKRVFNIFNLSHRYKFPIWGSLLIILTTVAISGALLFKANEDMRQDLINNSSSLANTLVTNVFQPLLEDDIWQVFEIISAPLAVTHIQDLMLPKNILILDNDFKVVVSTTPMLIPMGTRIDQLTPEYGILIQRILNTAISPQPTYDMEDVQNIYVAAPILSEGFSLGTLIVVHSKDVMTPRLYRTALHGSLVGLVVLLILLPVNWSWGQRLARPLVLLTERMKLLRTGSSDNLETKVYPYHDEVGQLLEAYHQIVEEHGKNETLEKQIIHSERLAAVGRLAAGVAHEINNPLGGMLTAIDTLKSYGEMDARTTKTIDLIARGLTQIKETVGALLVEARVRSRHLDPQDFEDIRNLVLPQSRDKELLLDWRSSLARSLPLQANQVRQVLINLLLNAIHAAYQKGLVVCAIEEVDNILKIRVENDGAQLNSEQMLHLFEPFSPISQTGHGLGLWITYQIVQQLGGKIAVEQIDNRVIFNVTLPFEETPTA
ncbi:MAG: two-component sensor histidine kinase [Comamonadaceae bacterium CG_4_9_14_3_um_filter_60_33]|nr:MAG: two-component sensor histidine kinase [Comamonadaceae bacterium CG_4_10_14_3_um_filter_60_42]PJB46725.1 MAG: two-component sensor histidine kinase [Comamonadaceae bacterium CG_4_9_14_3_um_filter_60_33]